MDLKKRKKELEEQMKKISDQRNQLINQRSQIENAITQSEKQLLLINGRVMEISEQIEGDKNGNNNSAKQKRTK